MADEAEFQLNHLCGWLGVDDTQRALAAAFPRLIQAAPHLFESPPPTAPVLLYKAWRDILGKDPAYIAQAIGDCCSFGHAHANDLLQCIEAATSDKGLVWHETDTEALYGMGREISNGLGRQDGSYGAAMVRAMTEWGMASRDMVTKIVGSNAGDYSGQRAKQWGLSGTPKAVKDAAASYKLGGSAGVTTWDELVAAITNGYPVTICTARGFNMTRDSDGFCKMQGRWGHCMFIAGIRFDRPGACIMQSWGADQPAGPLALDQPTFSFWAEQSAVESILGEGDSWAISRSPAFEQRVVPPDWAFHDAA